MSIPDAKPEKVKHGIWTKDYDCVKGAIPNAAEGSTMVTIGTKAYIFGGFSRKMFNDLREFDTIYKKWVIRCPDYNTEKAYRPKEPEPRSAHTMV